MCRIYHTICSMYLDDSLPECHHRQRHPLRCVSFIWRGFISVAWLLFLRFDSFLSFFLCMFFSKQFRLLRYSYRCFCCCCRLIGLEKEEEKAEMQYLHSLSLQPFWWAAQLTFKTGGLSTWRGGKVHRSQSKARRF